MRKKPKDLNASEREECGRGEGGGLYAVYMPERLFLLIFFIFFFKKRKKVSEIETKMFAASVFALNAPFPKQNSYTVRVAEIFCLSPFMFFIVFSEPHVTLTCRERFHALKFCYSCGSLDLLYTHNVNFETTAVIRNSLSALCK
jgi:hypothetical protein